MTTPCSSPDAHLASPWARGGRTLFLCPRPGCNGSTWCPEARDHLLVPIERRRNGKRPLSVREWARQRREVSA